MKKSLQEGLPGNTPGAMSSSHTHNSESALGFLMEHKSEVLGQQSRTNDFLLLKKTKTALMIPQKTEPEGELSL